MIVKASSVILVGIVLSWMEGSEGLMCSSCWSLECGMSNMEQCAFMRNITLGHENVSTLTQSPISELPRCPSSDKDLRWNNRYYENCTKGYTSCGTFFIHITSTMARHYINVTQYEILAPPKYFHGSIIVMGCAKGGVKGGWGELVGQKEEERYHVEERPVPKTKNETTHSAMINQKEKSRGRREKAEDSEERSSGLVLADAKPPVPVVSREVRIEKASKAAPTPPAHTKDEDAPVEDESGEIGNSTTKEPIKRKSGRKYTMESRNATGVTTSDGKKHGVTATPKTVRVTPASTSSTTAPSSSESSESDSWLDYLGPFLGPWFGGETVEDVIVPEECGESFTFAENRTEASGKRVIVLNMVANFTSCERCTENLCNSHIPYEKQRDVDEAYIEHVVVQTEKHPGDNAVKKPGSGTTRTGSVSGTLVAGFLVVAMVAAIIR